MLSQLSKHKYVVGIKQARKAIANGTAACLLVAKDAESRVCTPMLALCEQNGVPVHMVDTMKQLGVAANIQIGAAVVAVLIDV